MKNDGGPAFPRPISTDEHSNPCNIAYQQDGMSLRDWFAGMAPITWGDVYAVIGGGVWRPTTEDDRQAALSAMVKLRYEYADTMLMERKK